jgi:hypothetical protein
VQHVICRGTCLISGAAGLSAGSAGTALLLCGLVASLTLCEAKGWIHRHRAYPVGNRLGRCKGDSDEERPGGKGAEKHLGCD